MRVNSKSSALVALVMVLLVACTGTPEQTATSTSAPTPLSTSALPSSTTTIDPLLGEMLPVDDAVVVGNLDNGLVYYLRANDSPGRRAELRLLVDAGSVQEEPAQAGMAHFLEHMMFNGTERFPRNELVAILESFGPRFGPDINAYTSYDETVYELSLATDNPELLQLGVEVLREWATRATLTATDVVEERGVVLDEWRLRAQGFGARVSEEISELILDGSIYEDHSPIGTAESIGVATPEILEEFYERWYRPDRMAIVAVGDFDLKDLEDRIETEFSSVSTSNDATVDDEVVNFEGPSDIKVARMIDEEATQASVTVLYPAAAGGMTTVGDYQDAVAKGLALQILGERIDDEALAGDSPLLEGTVVDTAWTRSIDIRGLDVQVRAARVREGLEIVSEEIEIIRTRGVVEEEFDRALAEYASASLQAYQQRDSAQDVEFAAQIANHHLAGGHLMSPEQRYEIESGIAERITKAEVDAIAASMFGSSPAVFVLGPDDFSLDIPDEAEILDVLGRVREDPLVQPDDQPEVEELMQSPDPVEPTMSTVDPQYGYTKLEYENGATVFLWDSEIAANSVYALVEGFGGTSVVDIPDLPEALLMTDIAARSGLGSLDAAALRRSLSGRIAELRLFLTETRQGMEGSASTEDLESLFQLIHLTMTQPRLGEDASKAVLDEMATLNASRDDLPALLFEEALSDAYYGDDPRYFVVPTEDQLSVFDLETARSVYSDRFSNPASFAFVFVGDFDVDEVTTLASHYIGTIRGGQPPSGFVDNQPIPPRRVQVVEVRAGTGEQAQVGLFFTNEFAATPRDRVVARLAELIVTSRLRQRVREELSATYSISAGIDLQRDPDPYAEAFIVSSGDPGGLEIIVDEIVSDLKDLQSSGPSEAQFSTSVAQLRDELELVDNGTIAVGLVTAYLYPDQPFTDLSRRRALLDTITAADVQEMAADAFDLEQRIEVRQVPRG